MDDNILLDKISKLPANLKSKVSEFIDSLLIKTPANQEEMYRPVFGSGKGMFKMKPGFDEPLEDFNEYM